METRLSVHDIVDSSRGTSPHGILTTRLGRTLCWTAAQNGELLPHTVRYPQSDRADDEGV